MHLSMVAWLLGYLLLDLTYGKSCLIYRVNGHAAGYDGTKLCYIRGNGVSPAFRQVQGQ
jgi:hypothetical protein